MGLLFYLPAVFGILRHRHWPYWRWVVVMLVWVNVMWLLFAEGGLVTGPIEQSDHAYIMGLLALPIVVTIWGGIFFIVRRLYAEAKATGLGPASVKPASGLRKGAELIALTLACGLALYLNVIAIFPGQASKAEPVASAATVEADIDRSVEIANQSIPRKLDDITTVVGAGREGRTFVIDHEISSPDVTREVLESYLQQQKVVEACADEGIQKLLGHGGALRYRYKLVSGADPVEFNLAAADCGAVGARAAPAPTSPPAGTR